MRARRPRTDPSGGAVTVSTSSASRQSPGTSARARLLAAPYRRGYLRTRSVRAVPSELMRRTVPKIGRPPGRIVAAEHPEDAVVGVRIPTPVLGQALGQA